MRSLERTALHHAYRTGALTPEDVVADVYDRIAARGQDAVWIHLVPREEALAAARDLVRRFPGSDLPPLFGLPFGVKDNVDVAGLPTTAACPEFAYVPAETAPVVQRALAAGAVLIGKTNLDQFATGLSGTRSPYGIVRNPHHPDVIAGGSSSGSAVAVAAGLVTFAIGTDTAGSGRVPAGLTGTVGVKPSRGLVSTRGIVPACRSLDCASVFALTVDDGAAVLAVLAGPDPQDPFSRDLPLPPGEPTAVDLAGLRVGVLAAPDVAADFAGDGEAAAAYAASVDRLVAAGSSAVPVDLSTFLDVAALLYDGPWIAERTAGIGDFVAARPDAVHPVTRQVLAAGGRVSGSDVFRGLHALAEARRRTAGVWDDVDALMVPTAPTAPTIEQMLADPLGANAVLGRFTNFANLLDLAGIAVPSEVTSAGVPVGVTFLAPAGADGLLLGLGAAWQAVVGLPLATGHAPAPRPHESLLAVVGAHLEGEPLHADLLGLGARLSERTATAAEYRLYALPSTGGPSRPGLVRVPAEGSAIEAEVYRMPVESLGRLVTGVPAPLAIGTVRLADGRGVPGFLCEQAGIDGSADITAFGGWRAYVRSPGAAAAPAAAGPAGRAGA
jgi:allophanate hydrolase